MWTVRFRSLMWMSRRSNTGGASRRRCRRGSRLLPRIERGHDADDHAVVGVERVGLAGLLEQRPLRRGSRHGGTRSRGCRKPGAWMSISAVTRSSEQLLAGFALAVGSGSGRSSGVQSALGSRPRLAGVGPPDTALSAQSSHTLTSWMVTGTQPPVAAVLSAPQASRPSRSRSGRASSCLRIDAMLSRDPPFDFTRSTAYAVPRRSSTVKPMATSQRRFRRRGDVVTRAPDRTTGDPRPGGARDEQRSPGHRAIDVRSFTFDAFPMVIVVQARIVGSRTESEAT